MGRQIQLFSFDIVGSASYKTSHQGRGPRPDWIHPFQAFFENVPLIFTAEIARLYFDEPGDIPEVPAWKAIGDELVFLATPDNQKDLELLTDAFVSTVRKTNQAFNEQWGLQVHGVTWSFEEGLRNIAIRLRELESDDKAAMDLIGPDVDLGFRLITHAPSGGVLVTRDHAKKLEGCGMQLRIVGQAYLKGISLDAYPLITIDVDTQASQKG